MKVKIALIAAMLSSGIMGLWAQDQVEAHLGADIVSDYVWRGQDFGDVSLRAAKAIKITQTFELPLFGQVVANPASRHFYFIFGLTLKAI